MELPALLKSRRFWTAVIGIVVLIATQLNTELGGTLGRLQDEIVVIVGLLIGGYAIEDFAQAWKASEQKKDEPKV